MLKHLNVPLNDATGKVTMGYFTKFINLVTRHNVKNCKRIKSCYMMLKNIDSSFDNVKR